MNRIACTVSASIVVAASAFAGDPVEWPLSAGGNGHWYQLSAEVHDWTTASLAAQARGGHLVTLTSPEEWGFLMQSLQSELQAAYSVWGGGLQPGTSCEPLCDWEWVTGEPWSFSNWHPGEPNNYGQEEDYLEIVAYGSTTWNDSPGAIGRRFLVEWSADCNGDGIVDFGQIRNGQLADLNADNVPDVCQCPTPHIVRVPQDAPSIAAAVELACPGVPLEVVVAPGTWVMEARVPTTYYAPIVVRGSGGGETVITDAADGVRLMDTLDGTFYVDCRMKDLTVANVAGSRCPMVFENCLVRDCVATFMAAQGSTTGSRFERCSPDSFGAVLYTGFEVHDSDFVDCATPILWWADQPRAASGLTFTNTAGHAILAYTGCCASSVNNYTIEDCVFTGTVGNAVKLSYSPHPDAPQVVTQFINCTFTGNISPADGAFGGAVAVGSPNLDPPLGADRTQTTFTACTFTGNRAPSGGAIYMALNHPVVLNSCVFASNLATSGDGGAIAEQVYGGGISLRATGCSFVGNQAVASATRGGTGGAISAAGWNGALELSGCTFTQNSAASGGAVACDRQRFVAQNCIFEANESSVDGGAVVLSINLAGSSVRASTFRGNSAMRHGGALEMPFFITIPFEDCVFEMNSAAQTGGAVRVWYAPAVGFLRCAFKQNSALLGTSVYTYNYGSPLEVTFDACSISNETPASSAGRVIESDAPGVAIGGSVICGSGSTPFSANVVDAGTNCIVDACTDLDGNGRPDECDLLLDVPSQYATIQAAIDAAPAGVHRIVRVAAGTYNEAFALNGKDVVVRGVPGGATILDGAGLTTAIARFTGGEPATAGLQDLVFRNGTSGARIFPKATYTVGGALYATTSDAFVKRCEFRQNRADFGGAMYLYKTATPIEDCVFNGNIADDEGGAIMAFEATVTVRGSSFVSNHCGAVNPGSGSGFKSVGARVAGQASLLENCSFTGGIAGVDGAAVEHFENTVSVPGSLRIVGTQITGNSTLTGASGLRVIGRMQSCTVAAGTTICGNANRNVDGPYFIEGAVTICDCMADVAADGSVNGGDLGLVLNAWGLTNSQGTGDVNHDGLVNGEDLSILLSSWGACQ